jgi:carbonic anhydrase
VVEGEALPPEIEHLLVHIREAHEQTKQRSPGLTHHDLVEATVRANVAAAVDSLGSGPLTFRDRIAQGTLSVEGAVYALETGRVSWITNRVRR